ncbi:MAG TPA: hypothetical protein VKI19_11410, partial [Acidimicrobiales bacterium]|nr:hypothetical protein [Acidimicrobiales bacterium]
MSDPSRSRVKYTPGPHLAIAGGRACFLGRASSSAPLATPMWELVRGGADVDEILALLAEHDAGPDLAIMSDAGKGVAVTVAGTGRVELWAEGGTVELSCPAGVPRATYSLDPPPAAMVMRIGPEGDSEPPPLPLAAGVVSASSLIFAWEAAGDEAGPMTPPPAPVAAPPAAPPEPPAPPVAPPDPPARASEDTILPGTAPVEAETPPSGPAGGYDHLFGATINRTVEDAAVRAADEAADEPADEPAPPTAPATVLPPPPAAAPKVTPAGPAVVAPASGMIESVPWAEPAPGPTARARRETAPHDTAPPEAAPPGEDPAEMTIQRGA